MSERQSNLIDYLMQQSSGEDPHLSKRSEPRQNLRVKIQLDLRRGNDEMRYATVLSVSESGIGFLCRGPLDEKEQIELRLASEESSQFERFVVQRVTGSVGAFKVGVVAC